MATENRQALKNMLIFGTKEEATDGLCPQQATIDAISTVISTLLAKGGE